MPNCKICNRPAQEISPGYYSCGACAKDWMDVANEKTPTDGFILLDPITKQELKPFDEAAYANGVDFGHRSCSNAVMDILKDAYAEADKKHDAAAKRVINDLYTEIWNKTQPLPSTR